MKASANLLTMLLLGRSTAIRSPDPSTSAQQASGQRITTDASKKKILDQAACRPSPPPADQALALWLAAVLGQEEVVRGQRSGARVRARPRPSDKDQARRLKLREPMRHFCTRTYMVDKDHAPGGATDELARAALNRLRDCFGRELCLGEYRAEQQEEFRTWLRDQVTAGAFVRATADKHLRQVRSICNHAAKLGLRKALPKFLAMHRPSKDVRAWDLATLARIESHAATISEPVAGVPGNVWWTAWALAIGSLGCRIKAMMLAQRDDYQREDRSLLLRAENQKQRKDQRFLLAPRVAAAIERLLAAHEGSALWPWEHDPPRPGRRRRYKCLSSHFRRAILKPLGLALPKGVVTKQFRRTAATLCEEQGGNAQELLGHSSPSVTELYKDRRRKPATRQAVRLIDPTQRRLFE